MFAIGDDEWPGISKLAEECGEVIQVIGKLMATRGATDHWDGGPNLRDRLTDELADLAAAIEFVATTGFSIDRFGFNIRYSRKIALFREWHLDPANHG